MKIAKVTVGVEKPKTLKAGPVKRRITLGYHANSQVISESESGVKECYRIFNTQQELEDCMKKKENVWMHFELKYIMNDEAKERYENFVSGFLHYYDTEVRNALRTLYRTRNTNLVEPHRGRFVADGFIEYPKDGPGWLKPELRDIVGRTLDELGA